MSITPRRIPTKRTVRNTADKRHGSHVSYVIKYASNQHLDGRSRYVFNYTADDNTNQLANKNVNLQIHNTPVNFAEV